MVALKMADLTDGPDTDAK